MHDQLLHSSRFGRHQGEASKHHQPSGFNWSQVCILAVSSFHLVGVCECLSGLYLYLSWNWWVRVPDSIMGLIYILNCYLFLSLTALLSFCITGFPNHELLRQRFETEKAWETKGRGFYFRRRGHRDLDTAPFLTSTPLSLTQNSSHLF